MKDFYIHIDVVLDCDEEKLNEFLNKENLTIVDLQKLWVESFYEMIDDELCGDSGFEIYDVIVDIEEGEDY